MFRIFHTGLNAFEKIAVINRSDHIIEFVCACGEVGVGHTGVDFALEALAFSVSGRRGAKAECAYEIADAGNECTVVDDRGVGAERSLIIKKITADLLCADCSVAHGGELGEARRHLAAAGARRGDDDERVRRLDILVAAKALVAHDVGDVGGIARDGVVAVVANAKRVETLDEGIRRVLPRVLRDAYAADIKPQRAERVNQAQAVVIIGDAEVAAHLVLFNIVRVDRDDDLRVVAQLLKHADLAVGLEAGQHARSVKVVEELAAELQVQLAAELADALADVRGLHGKVFVVIKTDLSHRKKHPIFNLHIIYAYYIERTAA